MMAESKASSNDSKKTQKPKRLPQHLIPNTQSPQSQPQLQSQLQSQPQSYLHRYNQLYMPPYYSMQQYYPRPGTMSYYTMQPQQLSGYSTMYPQQLMGSPAMGSPTMFYMAPNQISGLNSFSMSPSVTGFPLSQQQPQQQWQQLALKGISSNSSFANVPNASIPGPGSMFQSNLVNSGVCQGMVMASDLINGGVGQGMVAQGGGQFQNFNQYQPAGINQGGGGQQAALIEGFNQMAQHQNLVDFMAQQQRAIGGESMVANAGQYMNQAPNVTMNNMMGQGGVGAYFWYQPTGGKPDGATQQFQNQQRINQMMQMQDLSPQNFVCGGGMCLPQSQSMGQQQNPNLAAQLQQQMPYQANMMGQQYQHQPPPY